MKTRYCLLILLMAFAGCTDKELQQAKERLHNAQTAVEQGKLNIAKIEIDSIHLLYPKQVAVRREAKNLQDSITYIEAQRNLQYMDSIRQTLLPQLETEIKRFKWEKQEKYEDKGRYVHRLLSTDRNTARCFLQCYIDEGKGVTLKSYYYGQKKLSHKSMTLSANDNELTEQGSLHQFEAEGWHEILTFNEQDAMSLLQFVSEYKTSRIKVTLTGNGSYAYYQQDQEKTALEETYHFAVLLKDLEAAEKVINQSQRQIDYYQTKHSGN